MNSAPICSMNYSVKLVQDPADLPEAVRQAMQQVTDGPALVDQARGDLDQLAHLVWTQVRTRCTPPQPLEPVLDAPHTAEG